jgi:hypothetical protein
MISNYLLPPPSLPPILGGEGQRRPAANLLNYIELRLFLLLFRFIIL